MKNPFANRRIFIYAMVVLIAFIYLAKLFHLQILDKSYRVSADNNVLTFVTKHPARGLIHDRTGDLIVYNEAAYDLMTVPNQVKEFDTTELCTLLGIEREYLEERLFKARDYSRYLPSAIVTQISSRDIARLQEKLFKYPGFFVQARTLRKYTRDIGAHILGYVAEVNEKTTAENPYYKPGDYIGKNGLEKSYEEILRGKKGVNIFLVDVHHRKKGPYQDGKFDTAAVVGSNITACFDAGLQEYGEKLMQNKIGSIVAIEPATGELLSLISSPTYKPSLLVGRVRSDNYTELMQDSLKPLFNRALMASYPPGSTFKTINGLIGLQEEVIRPWSSFSCNMGYYARGVHVACHAHNSPLKLTEAIQSSCNAYFCNSFRAILDDPKFPDIHDSFDNWREHLISFGMGTKLGLDLTNELKGYLPKTDLYDRIYGKNSWSSLTVISMAIGQGELGLTPLQMANMTSVIANRGYYIRPHIVKDPVPSGLEKHHATIDTTHYAAIIEGMDLAVNGAPGTGSTARIARLDSIRVCGKTGTAENPHGDDHSLFIAFAPRENPKIAISVIVENGGYGATWAAPIASLMIEKYLTGEINRKRKWIEDRMIEANLINPEKEEEATQ